MASFGNWKETRRQECKKAQGLDLSCVNSYSIGYALLAAIVVLDLVFIINAVILPEDPARHASYARHHSQIVVVCTCTCSCPMS